ncbi:MAG TPA: MATE family efflux transporter [Acidobacteriota bacterium]|nr:MATE family efflux transporter [Acidobacteriota bacterium]
MARVKSQKFDRHIVEGPIHSAVWKLAWPTMLQNVVAGLQGIVDHTLIGHYVGFEGNAAVGVSWQIFLVVVVFVGSVFTGMGILVARFAGAGDSEKVNRVVYQACLVAFIITGGILAPAGYLLAPTLLDWVNAAPEVQAEALPYLRTILVFSIGMLFYFLIAGALRAAGDARTPLRLGLMMTFLNLGLSVILIRGLGPIPAFGTIGAAMGTVIASGLVSLIAFYLLWSKQLVVRMGGCWKPDFRIIRQLFRFGLPTGFQGIAMNLGGVLLMGFVGALPNSAEAQAAYVVAYTQLFSLITWTSVGLMAATSTVVGQNLGAGLLHRARRAAVTGAAIGLLVAIAMGTLYLAFPEPLLKIFGLEDETVLALGRQLLGYLSVSGLFVTVALNYNGALQGSGDTRSPMVVTVISQLIVPVGILFAVQHYSTLQPGHVWLAIVIGHFLRGTLNVIRFHQGRWIDIKVDIDN